MAKKPVKAHKNTRKTETLTNLWQSLGGANNTVTVDSLLKRLNGEREYCVYGELNRKQRTVQVAEVGSHLVNRLGERYRAPTDEPGIAAAVMQKLSTLGNRLIAEQSPQLSQGAIAAVDSVFITASPRCQCSIPRVTARLGSALSIGRAAPPKPI